MKNVKVMLFGIALMVFSGSLRVLTYGYINDWIVFIIFIIGALISFGGFFLHDDSNELEEKILIAISKIKDNTEKKHTCGRCGHEYSEEYSYCPHCGNRE